MAILMELMDNITFFIKCAGREKVGAAGRRIDIREYWL